MKRFPVPWAVKPSILPPYRCLAHTHSPSFWHCNQTRPSQRYRTLLTLHSSHIRDYSVNKTIVMYSLLIDSDWQNRDALVCNRCGRFVLPLLLCPLNSGKHSIAVRACFQIIFQMRFLNIHFRKAKWTITKYSEPLNYFNLRSLRIIHSPSPYVTLTNKNWIFQIDVKLKGILTSSVWFLWWILMM